MLSEFTVSYSNMQEDRFRHFYAVDTRYCEALCLFVSALLATFAFGHYRQRDKNENELKLRDCEVVDLLKVPLVVDALHLQLIY